MIRAAREEDFKEVYSLICSLENKEMAQQRSQEIFLEGLKNSQTYFYVYTINNQIVGFISLFVKNFMHHDHPTGEIVELIVDENYRNRHIGSQLLDYVEDTAKTLNLEELELCTSTWRKDAHRFYERHEYILNHYNYIKKI